MQNNVTHGNRQEQQTRATAVNGALRDHKGPWPPFLKYTVLPVLNKMFTLIYNPAV